jgi:hypothetical protein
MALSTQDQRTAEFQKRFKSPLNPGIGRAAAAGFGRDAFKSFTNRIARSADGFPRRSHGRDGIRGGPRGTFQKVFEAFCPLKGDAPGLAAGIGRFAAALRSGISHVSCSTDKVIRRGTKKRAGSTPARPGVEISYAYTQGAQKRCEANLIFRAI